MVLERKIYKKLLEWKKESAGKKAILIEGARRIGKSTICEEFAKNEYKSYILIDFAICSQEVKEYFDKYMNDLDTFFMLLSVTYGKKLYPRESLIIFDEVQMFPKAREAVKYLVADGRYDYIETGSLISIKENVKDIVIPSEERHLKMYPLDFEEFCEALGERQIPSYIRQCFEKRMPLERSLHNKAMLLFIIQIVPYSEAAGEQLAHNDAADSSTAGIGKPEGDENACQKADRYDADRLFQYLREGGNKGFLHPKKESAEAGAGSHEGNSKSQQPKRVSGAAVF